MEWIILVAVLLIAGVLILVGFRAPEEKDPLQSRLAEFSTRDKPVTLEEIELSQPLSERVLLPALRRFGEFAARFTPQATLKQTQHKLDLAGNPPGLDATMFWALRFICAIGFSGLIFVLFMVSPLEPNWARTLGLTLLFVVLGYFFPELWLRGKIGRRKDEIFKAMPDALDLLTICVEAGLGFEASMNKVAEKWENDLSLAFSRALQEIRLGKLRREAMRDMADRMDVPDMTSFVAAVIQSEQLGVSLSKVLRIQSEQMRMKRRQRAEEIARQAPIKMMIPMTFLMFPAICIVLMGPSLFLLLKSALRGIFFGG